MTKSYRRIAIIGGGPGGLTLARVLQTRGLKPVVYERELTPESRQSQGGTLDLHPESGQRALELAGLLDKFKAVARYEGQDLQIMDKHGAIHFSDLGNDERKKPENEGERPQDDGPGGERPEIDRSILRRLLLDSLEPDTIRWGHTLRTATALDDGQSRLEFDNGHVDTVDLVIGADGTWSKVRPLVTSVEPGYSGITMIEIRLPNVDEGYPNIAKLVGNGSMFALSDNKGIIAQRNSDGRIITYLSLRVPQTWVVDSAIQFDDPDQARRSMVELYSDWSTEITDLIRYCDGTFIPRPLFEFPVNHSWKSRRGITLLGDAAHVMTNFGGKGANLAMIDGAELGCAIAGGKSIEEYEKEMFERTLPAAEETALNLEACMHPDAPKPMVQRMLELMSQYGG
jgi:2-polyprenyl-6-methoxyphenol hydroxylase-like FAD-dependent oxidoreductase